MSYHAAYIEQARVSDYHLILNKWVNAMFKVYKMALEACYCEKTRDVDCTTASEHSSREILVICKICYNGSEEEPLLSPCNCSGSIKYVHQSCLMKWLRARKPVCELCNYTYIIIKKAKAYEQVSNNDFLGLKYVLFC